jgi:hypothetical protein
MKKTKWLIASLATVLLIGLTIPSCKKKDTSDEEINTASDNANAEHYVSDITNMAAQASDGTSSMASYRTPEENMILGLSCATITTSGQVMTIVFNGNSTCLDGRTRSGSIVIDYSASTNGATHYRDPGFSCSVTSSNYVVDGNHVNIIHKTITNNTPLNFNPASTNLTWAVNAHVSIVKAGGGTIDWNCNRTKYLQNTSDTSVYHGTSKPISWWKARVGLEGTAFGTAASGESFTAQIMNTLVRDFGACAISMKHPIISGVLDFTKSGHPTRVIDYGNGSCDLLATITVNGHTRTVTLN